jgi:hypothetical protein
MDDWMKHLLNDKNCVQKKATINPTGQTELEVSKFLF